MSSFPGAADGQEWVDHVKSRVIAEGAKAFENYKKTQFPQLMRKEQKQMRKENRYLHR